jgi:hypothetical protein
MSTGSASWLNVEAKIESVREAFVERPASEPKRRVKRLSMRGGHTLRYSHSYYHSLATLSSPFRKIFYSFGTPREPQFNRSIVLSAEREGA